MSGRPDEPSLGAERCFAAGLVAALSIGLIEVGVLASTTELFADGWLEGLVGATHVLGLAGLLGILLGGLLAIWLPGVHKEWAPLLSPGRADELEPAQHLRAASVLVSTLAMAAMPVLLVFLLGAQSRRFTRLSLVGPYLALLVVVGLFVGALLHVPARRAISGLLGRMAPMGRVGKLPITPAILLAMGALSALGLAYALKDAELAVFDFRPAIASGAMILLALFLALSRMALGGRRAIAIGVALSIALGLGAIFGIAPAQTSARVLPRAGYLSRIGLLALRRALDFDGDGYSALMGGGDCNEGDSRIGPHARDVPNNGVDENCFGGDAGSDDPADADAARTRAGPTFEPRRLSMVILMIDTVRPDHLGVYGYGEPTSPNLDAWAEGAFVFDGARAQSPTTSRSLPSAMTGRYPSRVDFTDRFAAVSDLGERNELLFEIFERGGWRTGAVTSHWYFDLAPGIRRGVDSWDNAGAAALGQASRQSKAPEISRRLLARLDELAETPDEEPFLLFGHYFDPHSEYMPHPEVHDFGAGLAAAYDSELAFVDQHLGPVLERLEAPDLSERTLVVIFSDHGEALREHGLRYHGHTLFEEEIRVPLIIKAPGLEGRRVEEEVALIDLLPTLAELSGLEAPAAQGRSLLPLMLGRGEWPERYLFAEHFPTPWHRRSLSAVISPAGRKLIRDQTQNITMLFELESDPGEQRSLDLGAEDESLHRALGAFIDADPGAEEYQRTRGR